MPSASKSKSARRRSRSATKKNFLHDFREYTATHGASISNYRRAGEVQTMIEAARERIRKARSASKKGGSQGGGGRRAGATRKARGGVPSNVHFVGVIQREIIIPIGKKETRRRKH